MTTDQRGAGSGPTAQRPPNKGTLRDVWDGMVVVWWRFFDWLAIVPWKTLLLVGVLGLILASIVRHPLPFLMLFQIGFLYTGLLSILQQFTGDEEMAPEIAK